MFLGTNEVKETLKEIKESISEAIRELKDSLATTQDKISKLVEENIKITTALFGSDGKEGYHDRLMELSKRVECIEKECLVCDKEATAVQNKLNNIEQSLTRSIEKQDKIERLSWISFGILISIIFGPSIVSSINFWQHHPTKVDPEPPKIEIPSPLGE